MDKEQILYLKTRKKIYDYILKYPGLHLRELCRQLNIPKSSLEYHLNYLKKNDLVSFIPEKHYKRYYIKEKIGKNDEKLIKLFRQKVPRKIILLLLCGTSGDSFKSQKIYWKTKANPDTRFTPVSVKELIGLTKYWNWEKGDLFHLKKKRSTVLYHLNKIMDAEIIEKVRVRRETKYKLKDVNLVFSFIIKYKEELSNELIDTWLSWTNSALERYMIDKTINMIFNIFPHPYHA